ncbi:MAG TPA: tRNA lysidine(34) synthetase TilS [Thermoleophilaceae bacterium]|nr:tRNA lysidine(34) synthetase TilS [Thermoleophilaceae bacterium]
MTETADPGAALAAARSSGLVRPGEPLLVMLSGGADSVCLLDVAQRLGADVTALHVNYGLREASDADERHCRDLCAASGVELIVETISLPPEGNVQALARDARYRLAERHASGDYAAAHTLSDQAETVLYRLAVSPGRRALLGMEPRRGMLVRPLLEATAEETRAHCRAHDLAWREDASNSDPRFARARVRHGLLQTLREVSPSAERTIAETAAQLREEADVLDAAVADALERLGGGPAVEAAALADLGPGLARLILRRLAERAAGAPHPLSRTDVAAILALAGARTSHHSADVAPGNGHPSSGSQADWMSIPRGVPTTPEEPQGGTRTLDLGNGLRAIAEYGTLRFRAGPESPTPDPATLPIPGSVRFGAWEVEARAGGGGEVDLSAAALGDAVTVRGWRDGDRMRPLGLGGTKSLQDLFTDRKIPRELRRSLPVVEARGEIAWVAGVAVGERFAAAAAPGPTIGLSARRAAAT